MTGTWTVARVAALALLAAASTTLVGCSDELKAENEALRVQNTELQTEYNAARQALGAAEAQLSEKDARILSLEQQLASQPASVADVQPAAGANTGFEGIAGVDITTGTHGEVTVRVPGDVLFASGSVDLKSTSKQTLSEIAAVLKSSYAGEKFRVQGFTDTDPIRKSKWKDNLELSGQRAMAVVRYLASQDVPIGNMSANAMHTRDQRSTKAQSRRVEIVVVR